MIQKIPKLKTPKIINLAKTTLFKENRADISNSFIPYMADFVLSAISSNARKGVNADTIHTVFSLAKEAAHATVSYTHLVQIPDYGQGAIRPHPLPHSPETGAGREGLSTREFAMRLMHLGKESHWIWAVSYTHLLSLSVLLMKPYIRENPCR